MEGKRIICDTNVWYSTNFFKVKDKGLNLIGTYNSLWEITHGLKIINNFEETIKTYSNFLSFESNLLKCDPWTYLYGQQNDTYINFRSPDFDDMICFLKEMVNGNKIEKLDEFESIVKNKNLKLATLVSDFKKMKSVIKYQKKSYGSYKIENENLIKAYVNGIVNTNLDQKLTFNTGDWSKLELFIESFNFFIYEFAKGARGLTNNDLPDILNLIYVGPHDKYLTFERKGIKRIIKEAGCGHYLMEIEN
jgi:hypothetical protein